MHYGRSAAAQGLVLMDKVHCLLFSSKPPLTDGTRIFMLVHDGMTEIS